MLFKRPSELNLDQSFKMKLTFICFDKKYTFNQ